MLNVDDLRSGAQRDWRRGDKWNNGLGDDGPKGE